MASVGEILRRERERQGVTLAQIAQQTRIRQQYLEFLEKDDFESLPGRFFARSFTTQYAEKLGINTPELQASLLRQITPVEVFSGAGVDQSTPSLTGPPWSEKQFTVDPLPEGTASVVTARKLTASIVMLVAVMVACGAVFWLWQRTQISSTSASAPQTEPSVVVRQEPTPSIPEAVSPPAAQPSSAKMDQPPTPTALRQAAPTPLRNATSGRINLTVQAKEDTWLRITADRKVVAERVLIRGESTEVSASTGARILIGNAGGVDIRYNGNDIGQVGPRGQVRTLDFTPERFTVIEPLKKPAVEVPASKPLA